MAPVDSDPVTGSVTVALNPPDGQRGYVGIELTRAPVAPGGYYLAVRSVGSTPYRIRPAAHLFERSLPEHELEGSFAFFTVLGGEILDENFQRVEAFQVDQPKIAYVRMSDPTEVEDTIVVTFETFDEGDGLVDRIDTLTLTRVGRSAVFLSPPIELHPGFTEASGAQAMASGPPKTRTAPKGRAKVRNPSRDVAKTVTRWGDTYLVPFGLTLPLRVYQSLAFNHLVTPPRHYICSPPAGDCPLLENLLRDPASVQMTITLPAGADAEGERQLARMELEPGPQPEAGWYLRGIRMTMDGAGAPMTWSDGTARAPEGRLTVKATSPTLAELATARVAVTPPARLGERTDGYPVCHTPNLLLEPLVISIADKYGIPPHYLMSQVHKEAMKGSNGCLNEYSYRYEPYGFDFTFISGDEPDACENNAHKLLQAPNGTTFVGHPFFAQGLSNGQSPDQVEVKPASYCGNPVTPRTLNKTLVPVGAYPTAKFTIADFPGSVHWNVRIRDHQNNEPFLRNRPGSPLTTNEYRVDCRSGLVTFGRPLAQAEAEVLRVDFTPTVVVRRPRPTGFGAALASPFAVTTAEINQRGPNLVTPPNNPATTISAWAAPRLCADEVLTQSIRRYDFGSDEVAALSAWESCMLIKEDPSFDVQGQWYGGASFGLLQVWPANAASTIRSAAPDKGPLLRALYDPLTEPGTKLFIPAIGVEFGAAADVYITVRGEVKSDENKVWPYEGACASDDTAWPRTQCTWQRWWARRFAAFNRGSDDGNCKPNGNDCDVSEFVNYGLRIVEGSVQFVPAP